MGIPIIDEIVTTITQGITWLIYISPVYVRVALFFAILTFAVFAFGKMFDLLGVSHRIGIPSNCVETFSIAKTLNTSGINRGDYRLTAESCDEIKSCVNQYAVIDSPECASCSCDVAPILGIVTMPCTGAFGGGSGNGEPCTNVEKYFLGQNTSYFSYCVIATQKNQSYVENYSEAEFDECKNAGTDFLDYNTLFVATMVTVLGGFSLAYRKAN